MVIPAFDSESGHLPPGRYSCTLEEVEEHLVSGERFKSSSNRGALFGGLLRYLLDWGEVPRKTGVGDPILRSVWMAGSFVSPKLEPGDLDLTVIIDGGTADAMRGKPGSKAIRDLTQHRDGVKQRYGLEVFTLRWHPVVHLHQANPALSAAELAYLSDRGRYDDWWQRCRLDEADLPSVESCASRRGYLEVRW
ncbi:DUF6932 family protein [Nocardia takedensis]|uniref:DUF6932 family protein n=1 Tax=Nocardia takedensis TaxID=259390 RepID=UPI00030EAF19|nr:hypothetical protein [Nocardia takedensis]